MLFASAIGTIGVGSRRSGRRAPAPVLAAAPACRGRAIDLADQIVAEPGVTPLDSTKTFVGPNGTYYDERWRYMEWRGRSRSWNWAAALSFGGWLAYRRMYAAAALYLPGWACCWRWRSTASLLWLLAGSPGGRRSWPWALRQRALHAAFPARGPAAAQGEASTRTGSTRWPRRRHRPARVALMASPAWLGLAAP